MKVALMHDHYNADHLEQVKQEMLVLGPPEIKVLDLGFDDLYQAVEGCHRLRAAEELGITPTWIFVNADDNAHDLGLDVDDAQEKLACELGDWENYKIEFYCEDVPGETK